MQINQARLVLILVHGLSTMKTADITLLVKKTESSFNLKCVATGYETLAYGMTWIFKNIDQFSYTTSVSKYINQRDIELFKDNSYLSKDTRNHTEISLYFNLPAVLDRRWEDFEIRSNDYIRFNQEVYAIHLSILMISNGSPVTIKLQIGSETYQAEVRQSTNEEQFLRSTIIRTPRVNQIPNESFAKWNHYTIYSLDKATYKLKKLKKNWIGYGNFFNSFSINTLKVVGPNAEKVIWKLHDYKFLRIPQTNKAINLFNSDIRFTKSQSRCIALYLFTEESCTVAIYLCSNLSGDCKIQKEYSTAGKWIQIELRAGFQKARNYSEFIQISIIKSTGCFVAIDDVRCCSDNETRILELNHWNSDVSCMSLLDGETVVYYKTPNYFGQFNDNLENIGNANNISCEYLKQEKYCSKNVVCNEEVCYCPVGYAGNYCNDYPNIEVTMAEVTATSVLFSVVGTEKYFKTEFICSAVAHNAQDNSPVFNVSNNRLFVYGLMPKTNYVLLCKSCISIDCSEYKHVTEFATTVCKALYEVPRFTSFVVRDTEVIIDFPLPSCPGNIKYNVLIKAVKNITCHDYSRREIYTFNRIHIKNLHPYTKYNMSINLENKAGEGPYMYTDFFTLASEKITNEESLITISNNIKAIITLPKCDSLQGPLFYSLTSICLEAWCFQSVNDINFQYNESFKLMDFINNLSPFSKHQLEFKISRSLRKNEQFISKTLMIITPPRTPTKVLEPKATNLNGNLYINWKPPYPPTDVILGYIAEVDSRRINSYANCSLSNGCWTIYGNAKSDVSYSIEIMAVSKNVNELGPSVSIKSPIFQKLTKVDITENETQEADSTIGFLKSKIIPLKPTTTQLFTNITVNVMENCDVILQWNHPDATNANATILMKTVVNGHGSDIIIHNLPAYNIFGKYKITNLTTATVYDIEIEIQDSKYSARETNFQITTCNSPMPPENIMKGYSMFLIIVSSILIIVIMVILSAYMVNYRRKSQSVRNERNDLEDFYLVQHENVILPQREDFCSLMRTLVCNNMYTDLLAQEYKEIWDKMNIWYEIIFPNQFCTVAEKEEMHLNAHFIQGWRGVNTYIATQCPRGNYSVEIFWNTVWDKNIKIIVSLLTKTESELPSNKYWPDDVYKNTAETLEVKYILSKSYTDYVVREFVVTKNNQHSQIRHFNFFSFPYDDFPSYPISLINFFKDIKGIDITNAPILVHCSDGFGRTGVFIMGYNFMRSKDDVVNVKKYFEDIRKCRPMLINNFEQYQFVYYVLHQIFSGYCSRLSINSYLGCDMEIIDNKIQYEFNYLTRNDYIYKMFRGKRKMPNEIKATVIPGYENQCNFFAIQTVEKRNFYQFWKYLISSKIRIIIILQNIDQRHKFWPPYGSSCSFEDIHIQSREHYKQNNIILYKLNVLQKQQREKTITLIYYKQWDFAQYTPTSEKDFYSLLKCYYALNIAEEEILLCCKDGLIGCGLFICADLILQKIKYENSFDLMWAVHGLKFIDVNFMKHMDQHRFLYALVKYYLDIVENEDGYHEYSIVLKNDSEVENTYDKIL